MKVVYASHRLLVERHDHVSLSQSGRPRRAKTLRAHYHHAGFPGKRIETNHPPMNGHRLRGDADITAPDLSIAQQTAGNKFRGVDANRETDSLRRKDGRCVDSNNLATRIDQ